MSKLSYHRIFIYSLISIIFYHIDLNS